MPWRSSSPCTDRLEHLAWRSICFPLACIQDNLSPKNKSLKERERKKKERRKKKAKSKIIKKEFFKTMNYSLLQDNKYSFFLLEIQKNKYFLVVCSPSYTISVCPDYSYFHRKIILQLGMDISVVEDSLGMTSHLQC